MEIVPINDKVVVRRLEAEDKTAGGIVLPDAAKEKPKQGKVLSVGQGRRLKDGSRTPCRVRKGDRVLFASYSGADITVDGEELLILSDEDLLALVE